MSQKNISATIVNLLNVNKILKKVKTQESDVFQRKIERKEELQIVRIGEASIKTDEKAVGGVLLLLVNKEFIKESPLHWKTKHIERVCHSSNDVET